VSECVCVCVSEGVREGGREGAQVVVCKCMYV
jgi:hypothetical protein